MRLPGITIAALSCLVAFPATAPAVSAQSATASPWNPGPNSRARLLAAGGAVAAREVAYHAGLEIDLKPGAHTYWRQPGDAGVPPTISYEGSRNLKAAELRYPAPLRIDEGGLQVFGYTSSLILPIEVTPQDPAAPVHLVVAFSYAACEKICTPAEARGELDLAPSDATGPEAARIEQAFTALPDRVENGGAVQVTAAPIANGAKPTWRIAIERPGGPWRDLFAEAPEGWFFETKSVDGGFELIADEQPPGAKDPPRVTLTLAGARDFETNIDLPAR